MTISFYDAIKFFDNHQGWLTLIIFVTGYFKWKRMHVKERESNYYFDILEKIIALRYLILEIRQPRFLPKQLDQSYINQSIIPHTNTIVSHSYSILKSLSSREEILDGKNNRYLSRIFRRFTRKKSDGHRGAHKALTRLYRDEISVPIIKEMTFAITLFFHAAEDKELISIFFPSENKDARGKHEIDDTGLHIFDDHFNRMVSMNFRKVIMEIEKCII